MQSSNLEIHPKYYTWYKFFNSFFLGLSVGSIFTIYAPLDPSIYSIGGIVLAFGMIVVAKFYEKILNIEYFFKISLLVELVILVVVVFFLLKPYDYMTALLVYSGYQITFMFGSYLLRAETLLLKDDKLLSKVDIAKQLGNLAGMLVSFIFYKILEYLFGINDNKIKVYDIHFLLLFTEFVIIFLIFKSFRKEVNN